MKYSSTIAAFLIISVIIVTAVAGCTSEQPKTAQLPQERQEAATTAANSANAASNTQAATNTKQLAKNFYEFDKDSYEAALSEGKYVFLDFYANWCPICKSEAPSITAAFNELDNQNVVGFRVNYNDDKTDENEKALAKKLGVAYQHTKIVIAPDEKVVSRTLKQQSKQEVLDQIKESTAAAS